jgi:toxin HigB-1
MAIQSFRCGDTKQLYLTGKNQRWNNIARPALRKLDLLNAAHALSDLRAPPNNQLEALKKLRAGQHSIRVNDQYRICFIWTDIGPKEVEIVDYH